jgi:hypothetical protein
MRRVMEAEAALNFCSNHILNYYAPGDHDKPPNCEEEEK